MEINKKLKSDHKIKLIDQMRQVLKYHQCKQPPSEMGKR